MPSRLVYDVYMDIRLIIINIGLASFLASPLQASETLAPVTAKLRYQAGFEGLLVGDIGLEVNQQPGKADVTLDVQSSGIVKLFVKHSNHTTLTASGKNFTYPERVYETNYRTRKKPRHVKLTYKGGKLADSVVEPVEPPGKRTALDEKRRDSAYDLLYFLLRMRADLWDALGHNKTQFSMDIFDGKRLMQADFTLLGKQTISLGADTRNVIAIAAKRTPLGGLTKSEVENFANGEPPLTIYFSDDSRLIPLVMDVEVLGGHLTAQLMKECGAEESCLLGNSE